MTTRECRLESAFEPASVRRWMRFHRVDATPAGIAFAVCAALLVAGLVSCGDSPQAPLSVQILVSRFGDVVAEVPSGATCHAELHLPGDHAQRGHSLGGATILDGPGSRIEWTYSTPTNANGTGTHTVTCSKGAATGSASVSFALISADHD